MPRDLPLDKLEPESQTAKYFQMRMPKRTSNDLIFHNLLTVYINNRLSFQQQRAVLANACLENANKKAQKFVIPKIIWMDQKKCDFHYVAKNGLLMLISMRGVIEHTVTLVDDMYKLLQMTEAKSLEGRISNDPRIRHQQMMEYTATSSSAISDKKRRIN